MSDKRTRIDALLNHAGTVPPQQVPVNGSAPDVTVYVDGRQVAPDANGSTVIEITPTGFTPANVPPGRGTSGTAGTPQGTGPADSAHQPVDQVRGPQDSGFAPARLPPVEDIRGLGANAATVDITDPSGKHHVPYTVHKNPDGSLDISVPKGPGHPHDTQIHVAAGKHVQLDLSQDKDGHVKVQANPAPPQNGDEPDAPPVKDSPAAPEAVKPADPADKPADPAVKPPDPAVKPPDPAGGGLPAPSGGGAPPSGGGGGPSGGGGPPGGGGGMPSRFPPPTTQPTQGSGGDKQTKNADQTAMKQLGDKLASQPGAQMTEAASKTSQIHVGFPSFGVLGLPLNATHDSVRQSAVKYLADGHDQLRKWKSALHGNAVNWGGAENSSTLPMA